jgi:serine/threonine protein kinase
MFFRDQVVGKYKILSPLGSGGFGTVFLAEDTWIDKKVALKVPHRQTLDFSELLREPRLLATLSHPNIVTVLTAERIDDVFFIVMEYVQGETLEAISDREGALDLPRRGHRSRCAPRRRFPIRRSSAASSIFRSRKDRAGRSACPVRTRRRSRPRRARCRPA